MIKEIKLTKGMFAIVDEDVYEELIRHKWHTIKNTSGKFYAARSIYDSISKKKSTIFMHRFICNTPLDLLTDHKDGNGLNNTRENLRSASKRQNAQNQGRQKHNTSGYKGVYWRKDTNRWSARIHDGERYICLGCYSTPEEAHKSYCMAAKIYHLEFANFGVS